jgi:hypothetical protein
LAYFAFLSGRLINDDVIKDERHEVWRQKNTRQDGVTLSEKGSFGSEKWRKKIENFFRNAKEKPDPPHM